MALTRRSPVNQAINLALDALENSREEQDLASTGKSVVGDPKLDSDPQAWRERTRMARAHKYGASAQAWRERTRMARAHTHGASAHAWRERTLMARAHKHGASAHAWRERWRAALPNAPDAPCHCPASAFSCCGFSCRGRGRARSVGCNPSRYDPTPAVISPGSGLSLIHI